MAEADPALRDAAAVAGGIRAGLRLVRNGARGALRRQRHQRAHAPGGRDRRPRRHQRRRLRGAGALVPAYRPASDSRPGLSGVRVRADGRAAAVPGGERVRATTSPRAAAATSCGRSATRCTASRRDRVIGSSTALDYTSDDRGGTIMRKPEADVLDDGPQKPIRIWSRIGRRPLLAAGNSNGDIPMLRLRATRRQAVPPPARPPRRR